MGAAKKGHIMGSLLRLGGFASMACLSLACGGLGTDVLDGGGLFGTGVGGSAGAGGASAGIGGSSADGSAATADSAGTSGSAGTGGTRVITKSYDFDLDAGRQAWMVTYTSSAAGKALIDPMSVTVGFNTTDGQPTPGSLQLNIPYAMGGQYVAAGVIPNPPGNITGKVITARVKIVSGLESATDLMNSPAGAKLYVKSTGTYVYESGAPANLTSVGVWIPISFDYTIPGYLDPTIDPASFNPADIREIGIQIDSGGSALAAVPAVVLIDTVAY
jgi:hypothetical protein